MPYDGQFARRRNPVFASEMDAIERKWGIHLDGALDYLKDEWRYDDQIAMDEAGHLLAMDAQPHLITSPNSSIPYFLTLMVDPNIVRVLVTPSKAAEILGEVRKGTWVDETAMFPMVERTGEVSSYGDYNNNGRAGLNTNFPQRQSYLFQTIISYGEREMERAGRARIGWAAELKESAVLSLNKFSNSTYFFGVAGLQNYGLLNDPSLPAALVPGLKAGGNGNVWTINGQNNATANEIFQDIQAMFYQLALQTTGLVTARDKLVLSMSPQTAVALTTTNDFNVNVYDLLKKNFPNIRFEDAVQYGRVTPNNPQGIAAGEMIQLIAESIEGQETGYCAFNEKLRAHRLIPEMSSFKQKFTQGTWGAIIRYPVCFTSMVGV